MTSPNDQPRTTHTSTVLTSDQLATYHRDGFVVLSGAISETEIARLEHGFSRNPPLDGTLDQSLTPHTPTYPGPGRYTLANNCLKDPDLAFIAEHPTVVGAVADALHAAPRLSAFVIYDRTPGGAGIPPHNDYKRWRPVGSSMNWAFTIMPFTDFDAESGRLFVAPGSHKVERVHQGSERPVCVGPPTTPPIESYVDSGLRRGDLLIMNMHLWHHAEANNSGRHRAGLFNKYAAADAPPATGWLVYDQDVYRALAPENRWLLAVSSDLPLSTTRLLLTRQTNSGKHEVLVVLTAKGVELPGGRAETEVAIADWDKGNLIASLYEHLRSQLQIELPWVSYIGDYEEGEHLCRIYGYDLTGLGFPVPYHQGRWVSADDMSSVASTSGWGYESIALSSWLDSSVIRGKALTQAQSRINQYAY